MPTISITSPEGTISAPFDITAEVTFKPTLNATKGTITGYIRHSAGWHYGYLPTKSCSTENCPYSYKEITGSLYDMSPGGPYRVTLVASGGGTSVSDVNEFTVSACIDSDRDGYYAYNAQTCPQGNDCNDSDPNINPATIWYKDADNDGYSDGTQVASCQMPSGYKRPANLKASSGDCDDIDNSINPGATEICDNKDNNCSYQIDETCIGASCNATTVGSSAGLASGNLFHSQSLDKGFEISYNSLDTYTGPLGKGWTHNYNINITVEGGGSIALMNGDGKRVYFWPSEGVYYPEARSGEHSFIIKNADATYTLTAKDGTTYTFNSSGKLFQIKDRNNNATTLAYSGDDPISITDPAGKAIHFTYDSNHRIIQLQTPNSQLITFTYSGDLLTNISTQSQDLETLNWSYTYDSESKMLTKTDPMEYTSTYTYDSQGRLTTSTDPEGKIKSISYDQINNTATVSERDGGVWTYRYDNSLDVQLEVTDPQGNITTYTYDSNRNLITKTEPDGSTTSYTYDSQGNMTSSTDALNQNTTYAYNEYGQVTSITNSDGTTTAYEYDANGNLIKTTDATGASTHYQYDSKGNIVKIINPGGQTTQFTYDQQNNLISITDPVGQSFSFAYDASGNMTSQTDPTGATTRFEYNSLNQPIKVTDPQGNTTIYAYDANGNKTSQTDANGNVTKYEYNYKGQLIRVTDALGNVTTYTYGGSGCSSCGGGTDKLTAITDANGNATTYEYDTLGRLTKETNPLGNSINYKYDSKGNLISKMDANGNTITYTYDSLNRLTKKIYPDNSIEVFQYDTKGNITYAGNQYIAYSFSYDTNGRVLGVTDSHGLTIQYKYDAMGNKTKMTTPNGSIINYNYDNANRLASIIDGGGRTYSFQYDTAGRRTKLSMPNGASANYSYDSSGRLTSLTHTTTSGSTIASFAYTHDNVGNRLTKTTDTGTKYSYTYDSIYRLTEALSSAPGFSANTTGQGKGIANATQNQKEFYTYDPVGNRLSSDKYSAYTYNQANQLLTNGGTYSYDKNGNLVYKIDGATAFTYAYDYENRLIKVIKADNNVTTTSEYKYDPFGRRIEKKITPSPLAGEGGGEGVTRYVYDNEDIILEYDGNGNIGNRYIHGPGIDEPLAVTTNQGTYYYHADGLGSIVALTDSNGETQQTYEYDSFGNLKDQKNKVKQPYTYTGREWDKEAGLYYYRARYYDPKVGRFITKDPIGFNGGDVNLYLYAQANPVLSTDPFGLRLCRISLSGIGQTYLDDAFTPMVRAWINANLSNGISVTFTEAFRATAYQQGLATNPNAITPVPAGSSLHECGFAVDISWTQLNCQQRDTVVRNANNAGISWGGNFSSPDPVHFYYDPGNRAQRIQQAQQEYQQGVTYNCP